MTLDDETDRSTGRIPYAEPSVLQPVTHLCFVQGCRIQRLAAADIRVAARTGPAVGRGFRPHAGDAVILRRGRLLYKEGRIAVPRRRMRRPPAVLRTPVAAVDQLQPQPAAGNVVE
jgi:hypothetical protein